MAHLPRLAVKETLMKVRVRRAPVRAACLALVGVGFVPTPATAEGGQKPFNGIQHIVVIYEENHSFDNLYGKWGDVNGQHVMGLDDAAPGQITRERQAGRTGTHHEDICLRHASIKTLPS